LAEQPMIMDNPDKISHNEGDVAVLYCSVLNLGESTVTWRKMPSSAPLTIGTKSWVRDTRVQAEHVPYSSHWNLVIEHVRAQDAGEYECQVNRRKPQLRHKVTLLVKEKNNTPLPRIEISGQNVVRLGHVLQLTCDAILVDMSVDTVTWTKDGVSLPRSQDDRCRVHTSLTMNGQNVAIVVSKLEIRDTRHDDAGVYVCRTSEKVQMAGVKVDVQGPSCVDCLIFHDALLSTLRCVFNVFYLYGCVLRNDLSREPDVLHWLILKHIFFFFLHK
ncbi:unnamed protein product, partial [Candidula unifasciata]